MYNKHSKTIIKVLKQDRVYIVKYIVKSLNEFALISIIYTLYSKIIFSAAALDASLHIQTYKHNLITDFLNVDIASLNEKIKTYRL